MNVVGLMAADADAWRFAMLFSSRMALIALHRSMCALQFEIRKSVIEGFGIKLNNIEFAAFMIGVAGFALGGGNAWTFAVKTAFS